MKDTTSAIRAHWAKYNEAKEQKAYWTAMERDAKTRLMNLLDYHPDDEKPAPEKFTDQFGDPLFEVKVSQRRTLDTKLFRNEAPDVYAQYEKISRAISIVEWNE